MKIGLASDSFGNLEDLARAFDGLAAAGAQRIFFLGGRYADVDSYPQTARVVRIASRACPEYERENAPRKVFELVNGLICCLVHDKSELTRDDIANATVLFHGNSGRAALVQIGPRFFVTPGHLRSPAPEGQPATYALLDLEPEGMELTVFSADGRERSRERAAIGARGRLWVK